MVIDIKKKNTFFNVDTIPSEYLIEITKLQKLISKGYYFRYKAR